MSVAMPMPARQAASRAVSGRSRVAGTTTNRVRRDGKFFRLGDRKFHVKGVTYGPFAPNRDGEPLPDRQQVRNDFEQIRALGANTLRIYHVPPRWFLDLAQEMGLKIFLDIAWPKNLLFVGDPQVKREAIQAVRHAAEQCGNHPAVFALSVVNEIPPDIVRFAGHRAVERFIDELVDVAHEAAPDCLVTFANFPTTEYLAPRKVDFVCFNVYLHDDATLRNYLARLQSLAGEKPLLLGEYGVDTMREQSESGQAQVLSRHIRAAFDEGLAGTFIFSFTDDWHVHGHAIEDWAFGLVRRDRSPKPAFHAVQSAFARAPHLADEKLPSVSVIICSYNGAATVESCLRSMRKLNYPDYEVVFVDDGSTDNTQDILRRFPEVRNIRQKNMGLSYARNVGLAAAKGEVVVYTDSDCEADEDWLYYLVLALIRGPHVGMGGPNLIPDEGSWVADCVGLSPGGPTHVMLDDRTAEHVPGCNMAFYAWAARQVNGFDPQFRKAGDDVDFIWRLQQQGFTIGFAPSAQVWHYRRNTVKAYLKQQRGYGEAEALLKFKHPDRFNALGSSHWRGRIYGADQIGVRVGADVIYHGVFGTGLFQTIYRRPASLAAMMMMSIEWHLLAAFITILGLGFAPLLYVAGAMFLVPVLLAATAALQAPAPRHRHWLTRPLIAYLHWRQPIARGWARYSVRLKAKVLRAVAPTFRPAHPLPTDPLDPETLKYWSTQHDRFVLLKALEEEVRRRGWRSRTDSGWAGWDMEIYGSRYGKVRIVTATEHHHGNGMLTRVRVSPRMSRFCQVLLGAGLLVCLLAFAYARLWPFNRPIVLIPMAVWAMYVVNRWTVTTPVLALVDAVSRRCGFYPVYPRPAEAGSKPVQAKYGQAEAKSGPVGAKRETAQAGVERPDAKRPVPELLLDDEEDHPRTSIA